MTTESQMTARTAYPCRDRAGAAQAVHLKIVSPDGGKRFVWEQPDGTLGLANRPVNSLPLYGIDRLDDTAEDMPVYLTEGEKAADALVAAGLMAVGTVTGANGTPDDEVLSDLAGRDVRLWPDNDAVGRAHMDRMVEPLVELGASPSIVDWTEAPEHGDAADFIDAGHDAADVRALPNRSAPLEVEGWAERIRGLSTERQIGSAQRSTLIGAQRILPFWSAREFAESTPPDVDWIAKPWVAAGSITGIDGKIKAAGKTTLATHLCRAVVEGRPFLGEPTRRTGVVYLTEQPPTSLRESLRRADLLDRGDFVGLFWRDCAGIPWVEVVEAAVRECGSRSAGLLVVDTLSRFAGIHGDGENDAGEAEAAMAPLQIAAADGLAIVVTRHERKAGGDVGDSGRGSTAFGGATDIILAIRRSEAGSNVRKIYALSRFDETPDILAIELTEDGYVSLGDDGAIALRETTARLTEILPADAELALSMGELVTAAKATRSSLQRALDPMVQAGRALRSGAGTKGDAYRWWAPIAGHPRDALEDEPGTPWTLPWRVDPTRTTT